MTTIAATPAWRKARRSPWRARRAARLARHHRDLPSVSADAAGDPDRPCSIPVLRLLLDVGRPLWGLVLGHTLVSIPYVVRTTLAVLQNFDTRLDEAARNLGAGPLRTYFEVTLPLTKPGVMAGAVFAFIVSFDQFPVSLFLVSPGRETLPITLFNYLKFDLDGTIGAASVVSILLAVLVVFGLDRTVGLRSYAKL
jgi:putative spermidine/putrescine transport system permease protein